MLLLVCIGSIKIIFFFESHPHFNGTNFGGGWGGGGGGGEETLSFPVISILLLETCSGYSGRLAYGLCRSGRTPGQRFSQHAPGARPSQGKVEEGVNCCPVSFSRTSLAVVQRSTSRVLNTAYSSHTEHPPTPGLAIRPIGSSTRTLQLPLLCRLNLCWKLHPPECCSGKCQSSLCGQLQPNQDHRFQCHLTSGRTSFMRQSVWTQNLAPCEDAELSVHTTCTCSVTLPAV